MTPETVCSVMLGALTGASLTYLTLWRHVVKLERFGVSPSAWHKDEPHAAAPALKVVRS